MLIVLCACFIPISKPIGDRGRLSGRALRVCGVRCKTCPGTCVALLARLLVPQDPGNQRTVRYKTCDWHVWGDYTPPGAKVARAHSHGPPPTVFTEPVGPSSPVTLPWGVRPFCIPPATRIYSLCLFDVLASSLSLCLFLSFFFVVFVLLFLLSVFPWSFFLRAVLRP